MSQLIVHPVTVVDSIPISRRIMEIMTEKSKYYTITAMASRIGIHRETLRYMLKGDREIYTFELDKIAQDLKTTSSRIRQDDFCKEAYELKDLLTNRQNPHRALALAEHLSSVALGCTEKCIYTNYLGWALFSLQKFEQAHSTWLNAYEMAEEISEKYGENELSYRVLRNLMISYIEFKEYSNAIRISENVEMMFDAKPIVLAELLYIKAKAKESQGNPEEARDLCYKTLDYAIQAANDEMIGRACVNVAHFEYFLGNYQKSAEMLDRGLQFLLDIRIRLIAEKDLAKTLIRLGQPDRATKLILSSLEVAEKQKLTFIAGKFKLLLSRATGDIDHALAVVNNEEYDYTIRNLSCVFLMEYYKAVGDSFNFMHYHGIAENLRETSVSDILDLKEL